MPPPSPASPAALVEGFRKALEGKVPLSKSAAHATSSFKKEAKDAGQKILNEAGKALVKKRDGRIAELSAAVTAAEDAKVRQATVGMGVCHSR